MATIRKCGIQDIPALQALMCRTFYDTYARHNTKQTMDSYMARAFTPQKLKEELLCPDSSFYFIYQGETPSGYLKCNDTNAQTDFHDEQALEVERIYVLDTFKGKGLGRLLIGKAEEQARRLNKRRLILGVWKQNPSAILFYRRMGFYETGTHYFVMGEEKQEDFVMCKDLAPVDGDSG